MIPFVFFQKSVVFGQFSYNTCSSIDKRSALMDSTSTKTTGAWDQYWQGDTLGHAYNRQGESQPALQEFWLSQFNDLLKDRTELSMVDLACGNGALTHLIHELPYDGILAQTCIDVSEAALANVQSQRPRVQTVQSDLQSIDLKAASFDLVVSQFGVEYAGSDAFLRAIELVNNGGFAQFIIHHKGSVIEHESQRNHDAVEAVINADFLGATSSFMNSAFNALKDPSFSKDPALLENKHHFKTALSKLENTLSTFGVEIAGGTLHKLYNDVADILERLGQYDSAELHNWLDRMAHELVAYRERMASMLNAALSEADFTRLKQAIETNGFTISSAGSLLDTEHNAPLAWALVAQKHA